LLNSGNEKQLTINERHGLGSHEEQLLLFLLVHLILCYADRHRTTSKRAYIRGRFDDI